MASQILAKDWSRTPVGPLEGWPQSLRTAVDIVLGSGHAMMLAWGPERTLFYNDAYAPMLGERHPGALGLPFREAWPEIWDEISPLVDRVFAGETVRNEELYLEMTRKGYTEDTWWNFSYSPVRDEAGAIAGLLNVTVDATPKVRADRAELALRESEMAFQEQFANANDFIFTADLAMHLTTANPAVATALGHSPEALIGRSISEFVPPEMWERNKAMLATKLSGESDTTRYEVEVFDAQGERMTWEINSRLTRDASGKPTGLHAIGRDVTERKASERALRESEERLRLIYDSLDEYAIITLDRRGIVRGWNEGAQRLLGYDEDEAMGMDGCRIFTPEDRAKDAAQEEIDTALREGRATNERWHLRKDGSRFWGSGAVLSMLDGNGNGNGELFGEPVLVKIMRDETERVLGQERQDLLLAELQHRVRNLLAMVRSVARQSHRGDVTTEDYVAHLVGRYDAMARTQVLLTRDPNARVDLEGLVREELRAQTSDETRFVVRGPNILLPAKAAEVVTLAVHELATNSVKYGVLGQGAGRLTVRWTQTEREGQAWVELEWTEAGLLDLARPRRQGFGTELIEQRVPYELRGEGKMRFTSGGLEARIAFPLFEAASILETGPARHFEV